MAEKSERPEEPEEKPPPAPPPPVPAPPPSAELSHHEFGATTEVGDEIDELPDE